MKLGIKDIRQLAADVAEESTGTLCSQFRKFIGLDSARKLYDKSNAKGGSKSVIEIATVVDDVYANIKEYNKTEDMEFLRVLLYICERNEMTLEKSKMHRNIGMYYFQSNKTSESIEEFKIAISLAGEVKNNALKAAYYSDLGLVHYYNNEFSKARHCYEIAGDLLPSVKVADNTHFLHNYRSGILYNSLQEYEAARKYMEGALAYACNEKDKGFATMNLGIIYKKQRNFDKAIECYRSSLDIFEEDDNLSRSVVYNNLAELHKMYAQYDKALYYINLAFENINEGNMTKRFMYFNTYTEIKILMGEPEQAFGEFLELLSQVEDYYLYKSFVLGGINDMALLASEDGVMLDMLEKAVAELISKTGKDDEEYKRELKACMNNIGMYKSELSKQKNLFI